jgi:hypothetical protein
MSVKRSLQAVGLASATSADGTPRNGTAIATVSVHPGTLMMECSATIVTGSVVATFDVQGSMDNTTFVPIRLPNNAALVTITATATRALPLPEAASVYPFLRAVATLSGAATAAGDLTAATFRYLKHGSY